MFLLGGQVSGRKGHTVDCFMLQGIFISTKGILELIPGILHLGPSASRYVGIPLAQKYNTWTLWGPKTHEEGLGLRV